MHMAYMSLAAAHCRGGYYFCLDTKGSKKSSQQKGFFAAHAMPCKSSKTWAAIFLPCCRYALAFALL